MNQGRSGCVLSSKDLPFSAESPFGVGGNWKPPRGGMKESVETLERQMISRAMEEASNHQTKAAGLLGISERMLRYKLSKYGFK
jgi:transcriptional regulator with PAS, ATPase and Fis domain